MGSLYAETDEYANAMDPSSSKGNKQIQWANYYLGAATSIKPAQAMKDILGLPNSGIENVELSVIEPKQWELIPKQMFAEMRRLGQMNVRGFLDSGKPSPVSVHAPMVEPTGFSDQQNKWVEHQWRENQKVLKDAVEKATILGPNTPLTIHGSHFPSKIVRYDPVGAKYREGIAGIPEVAGTEKLKTHQEAINLLKSGQVPEVMYVVEPVNGEIHALKEEEVLYPGNVKHWRSPEERLDTLNKTYWEDTLQKPLMEYQRAILEAEKRASEARGDEKTMKKWLRIRNGYVEDLHRHAMTTFDKISRSDPKFLENPSIRKEVDRIAKLPGNEQYERITDFLSDLGHKGGIEYIPQTFQPLEDFGREKAAETFADVALHSVKTAMNPSKELREEFGIKPMKPEQATVISIENIYPWAAFGRGETVKALVDEARKKFEEKAKTELKMSGSKAKELANKLIGATWDVGHINLMRRFGYDEKAVANEIEAIKKDVKHIHITDNFGSDDSHLAPGMGNVPIGKFMEALEKEGKLKDIRGIVESGAYVAEWKDNPTLKSLEYFNAPVYGFQKSPTWGGESVGSYFLGTGGYSAGYGRILPERYFSEYNIGFTTLPSALGAVVPGAEKKSAFSGTPNA